MAEPNAGLYRTLSLAASTSAKRRRRSLARQLFLSCDSFRVRKLLPHSRRYLMLLKPDRVDILETVKWIALCQIWTIVDNDFVCV